MLHWLRLQGLHVRGCHVPQIGGHKQRRLCPISLGSHMPCLYPLIHSSHEEMLLIHLFVAKKAKVTKMSEWACWLHTIQS